MNKGPNMKGTVSPPVFYRGPGGHSPSIKYTLKFEGMTAQLYLTQDDMTDIAHVMAENRSFFETGPKKPVPNKF